MHAHTHALIIPSPSPPSHTFCFLSFLSSSSSFLFVVFCLSLFNSPSQIDFNQLSLLSRLLLNWPQGFLFPGTLFELMHAATSPLPFSLSLPSSIPPSLSLSLSLSSSVLDIVRLSFLNKDCSQFLTTTVSNFTRLLHDLSW